MPWGGMWGERVVPDGLLHRRGSEQAAVRSAGPLPPLLRFVVKGIPATQAQGPPPRALRDVLGFSNARSPQRRVPAETLAGKQRLHPFPPKSEHQPEPCRVWGRRARGGSGGPVSSPCGGS